MLIYFLQHWRQREFQKPIKLDNSEEFGRKGILGQASRYLLGESGRDTLDMNGAVLLQLFLIFCSRKLAIE